MPATQIDNEAQIDNSIHSVSAITLPDNRVRAVIELDENHSNPNLELTLTDANKSVISRSFILETISAHVEFTLHVRIPEAVPPFTLTCCTYLDETIKFDTKSCEVVEG